MASEEVKDKIEQLYLEGNSGNKVAYMLGLHATTVYRVIKERDLAAKAGKESYRHSDYSKQKPNFAPKDKRPNCRAQKFCPALITMLNEFELSGTEIAEIVGTGEGNIVNFLKRRGLKKLSYPDCYDRKCISKEDERRWIDLANSGYSYQKIAKLEDRNPATISTVMTRNGYHRGKGHGPAMAKTCPVCGKEFKTTTHNKVYCSLACYREAHPEFMHCSDDFKTRCETYGVYCDETVTRELLLERDNCTCYICGQHCDKDDLEWGSYGPTYPTVEHLIPLSQGGEHTLDNCKIACAECNLKKGTMLPGTKEFDEFVKQRREEVMGVAV